MKPTDFRIACEAYDRVAGPEDWETFGTAFDGVLEGLATEDLDVVGRLLDLLKQWRAGQPDASRVVAPTDDLVKSIANQLFQPAAASTRGNRSRAAR